MPGPLGAREVDMLPVLTVQVGMGVACDMHELQRDYRDEVEFTPQVSSSLCTCFKAWLFTWCL